MSAERVLALLLVGLAAGVLTGATLVAGFIFVADPAERASSVELIDSAGDRQRLMHLPFVHAGIIGLEGWVEVTCRDGRHLEAGYVTPHIEQWMTLDASCSRLR
jgi:hypothetical protein